MLTREELAERIWRLQAHYSMPLDIAKDMLDHDKEQRATLAEKERELQQIREHEFQLGLHEGAALNDKLQAELDLVKAERDELKYKLQVHADLIGETEHRLRKEMTQLKTDLDRMVGEAVKCVTYLASPYIDDSMRQTAQETFTGHPIVQSWQARQATAPSSLAADLHKGRLADEEVI